MQKQPSKTNPRNADGSYKTIGQMMKSQMTVLAYGKYLSQTARKA